MKVGFFGLLTIAFVVLKLCGIISWSWFWVLSPMAIPIFGALCTAIFVFYTNYTKYCSRG